MKGAIVRKGKRNRYNQKWIFGIGAIFFIIFFTGIAINAQVPLSYPYYSPVGFFTPYSALLHSETAHMAH